MKLGIFLYNLLEVENVRREVDCQKGVPKRQFRGFVIVKPIM